LEEIASPETAIEEVTPLNPALDGEAAMADLTATRRERLRELLMQSLKASSPLAASFGAARADLLSIGARLMAALESETRVLGGSAEEFERIVRAAHTYLRIARQVERLAELDVLLVGTAIGRKPAPVP
jgi:hypothetical protein